LPPLDHDSLFLERAKVVAVLTVVWMLRARKEYPSPTQGRYGLGLNGDYSVCAGDHLLEVFVGELEGLVGGEESGEFTVSCALLLFGFNLG